MTTNIKLALQASEGHLTASSHRQDVQGSSVMFVSPHDAAVAALCSAAASPGSKCVAAAGPGLASGRNDGFPPKLLDETYCSQGEREAGGNNNSLSLSSNTGGLR
jgi:hypothetical protein